MQRNPGFVRGMTLADYVRISTQPEWKELPISQDHDDSQTPTFGRLQVPCPAPNKQQAVHPKADRNMGNNAGMRGGQKRQLPTLRKMSMERLSEQIIMPVKMRGKKRPTKIEVRKSSRGRKERFNTHIQLLVYGKGKNKGYS